MKAPSLVQRGEICRPLNKFKGTKLSRSVDLDYMGNSNFEWGAKAKSLRAIQEAGFVIEKRELVNPQNADDKLVIRILFLRTWGEQDKLTYLEYLEKIRYSNKKYHLDHYMEEDSEFGIFVPTSYRKEDYRKTDFWWDIKNHVMWSMDKKYMARLGNHLQVSWDYMDDLASEKQN